MFAETPKATSGYENGPRHPQPAGSRLGFLWWDFSSLLGVDEARFQAFLCKHDGYDPLFFPPCSCEGGICGPRLQELAMTEDQGKIRLD